MTKLKTLTGYQALYCWYRETSDEPIGYIVRQTNIPSPYAYSPTHNVHDWNGKKVIVVETKHRHYEVYDIGDEHVYTTEEEATQVYIKRTRPVLVYGLSVGSAD
jgi:hypothetical protein